VDFFGVAAEARVHVILFIVLAGSWVAAQKWLMNFYFTRLIYFPLLRLFVVTAGAGILGWPALLFNDVHAVFDFVASVAIVCVWVAAFLQIFLVFSPHFVPTLQHPLWVKHTAPLLNAPWFVRARTTYNEIYAQVFTTRERRQEEFAGSGPWGGQYQQQQQSHQSNADDGRITYERALEITELSEGYTEQDVREAHKRLMHRVHPDVGGSNFFAKQLNAAREVLLERLKKK
jgi:hypothetical protein